MFSGNFKMEFDSFSFRKLSDDELINILELEMYEICNVVKYNPLIISFII